MSKSNNDQIGRVLVHCVVAKQIDSLGSASSFTNEVANEISSFCHNNLPLLLDKAFKKIFGSHEGITVITGSNDIISIDTLKLDLGQIRLYQLEEILIQKLEDSLRFAQYSTPPISMQEWFFRMLEDYLSTGISPWNSGKLSEQEYIAGLRSLCLDSKFGDFLHKVKEKYGDIVIQRLASLLNGLGLETEWSELHKEFSLFSVNDIAQNEQTNVFMNNPILLKNAGIVLLVPFLPFFFKSMHLVDDDYHFFGEKQRWQAVYMLHHLPHIIRGKEEEITIEGDLALNKILCGCSMYEPLPLNAREFPSDYKDEVKSLITAVFEQWEAVRNYSHVELAENFFLRLGIIKMEIIQSLYVECQTQDKALKYLPWTLSIIQTPWMTKPLRVDWNK